MESEAELIMTEPNAGTTTDRCLEASGLVESEAYRLALDEVAWLLGHASRLSATRLELPLFLQIELPGDGGDLKELLIDLLIMESRLAGRGERLQDRLAELTDETVAAGVSMDEQRLREAVVEILEAATHVETAEEYSP